jgi:hypothetical protein
MKKATKLKKPRMTFAERLAGKLLNIGDIDTGVMSDRSASWVCVKVGLYSFNFTFDAKGEKIERLGLYKEVWQMVDEKQLLSFDAKEEQSQ